MSYKLGRLKEVNTPQEFFARLKSPDVAAVKAIIYTIESLTKDASIPQMEDGSFLAIYGIAGYVSKKGERRDIDLLVATNAVWTWGFRSFDENISWQEESSLGGDLVAGTIRDKFVNEGYTVTVEKKIPNMYRKVGAPKKGMLRLTPPDDERKPIDIVIVNRESLKTLGGANSQNEFEEFIDVDKFGKQLPRVLLFSTELISR